MKFLRDLWVLNSNWDASAFDIFIYARNINKLFFLFAEKLHTSEGRELRRALFSLKQIFQEDKDLVHGFVGLGGLNCLVQIGNEADQNYQNYILRALGQVNLFPYYYCATDQSRQLVSYLCLTPQLSINKFEIFSFFCCHFEFDKFSMKLWACLHTELTN